MLPYIKLLRPQQWVKNFFVFIPLFFSGRAFDYLLYPSLVQAFFSFCLMSSAVYIMNDYRDIKYDLSHPVNKFRPLASGQAKKIPSLLLMVVLVAGSAALAISVGNGLLYMVVVYLVINIFYTLGLKHVSILDIFLVSIGFLIRVYAGGFAAGVSISHWLALMIMLLALFLTLAKRRDDLLNTKEGVVMRRSSSKYNMVFINSCLVLFAGIIIVAYIMYTVSPEVVERFHSEWLFATVLFVIAGVMRYLQITFVEEKTGNPSTILVTDRFIIFSIIGWIVSFYIIIYLA